ncbi:MAG: hypothetical protein DLM73_10775 [Chthoniobacterales bacterium]|nr:MAG: hypothetical protein DLM73_10775 [Chthoniobacterales bacterium]
MVLGQGGIAAAAGRGGISGIDGRAAKEQRMSLGGAAVILKRAEPRIDRAGGAAELVASGITRDGAAGADAYQVIALGDHCAGTIWMNETACSSAFIEVAGDKCVFEVDRAIESKNATAVARSV